ncbi:crotonase/enoyl-CoA hydratase family protein [Paraglaciecola sp.]|uniref:crotonase/enoyl-CoA hydratase family protein n=1 Tax=Paraglaciecola sp. TaxID=1920173 RepID=UPI003EF3C0A2
MSELVTYDLTDKVATIGLRNGKVNAFSHGLIDAVHTALDQAEQDQAVVVITGQPGILSAGFDLQVMRESPQAANELVAKGFSLLRRLLVFPTPIMVACSGHAVALGAFLCLVADYRIGVAGDFKIGLNEVAIGMTLPYTATELAKAHITPEYFNRSVLLAQIFSPDDAVSAGFLDQVVSESEFKSTVTSVAKNITTLNMSAHHETKLRARAALLQVLDESTLKDQAATK